MSSKEVLDQAAVAVRHLGAADVVSDAALADELAGLRQLADVAEAAYVAKLWALDTRGASEVQEALTTKQWARFHFQVAAVETARLLRIGKVLAKLPVVEAALLEGSIRMPHASAIADAAAVVGVDVIAECQEALVEAARVNDPVRLRAALRGLGLAIDSKNQRKRAERQHLDRWLDVAATFEGAVSVEGVFDAETGAIVQAAIDSAAKPAGVDDRRTAAQRRADALVDICSGLVRTPRAGGSATSTANARTASEATAHEGMTDAAASSTENGLTTRTACVQGSSGAGGAASTAGNGTDAGAAREAGAAVGAFGQDLDDAEQGAIGRSGCACGGRGARPSLTVVCDLATLAGESGGFGELGNGQALAGDAVRRLACDASITRVITDGASMPLDVGRAQRTVTTAQLKALRIRDGGCRFPGCDRPVEWSDVHHVIWWANGGRTDIANLILLCRKHHTCVHEGGWSIKIIADGGVFEFVNPDGKIVTDESARATRPVVNTLANSSTKRRR